MVNQTKNEWIKSNIQTLIMKEANVYDYYKYLSLSYKGDFPRPTINTGNGLNLIL